VLFDVFEKTSAKFAGSIFGVWMSGFWVRRRLDRLMLGTRDCNMSNLYLTPIVLHDYRGEMMEM